MNSPVFLDPSGKRSIWVSRLGMALTILIVVCGVLFARTLLTLPFLPHREGAIEHRFRKTAFPFLPSRQEQLERFLLRRAHLALFREIAADDDTPSSVELSNGVTSKNNLKPRFLKRGGHPESRVSSTRTPRSTPVQTPVVATNAPAMNASAPPIVAAFYATYQTTGLNSLRANASRLTHVMPEWLHLDATGTNLDLTDWNPSLTPKNLDVVKIAQANHLQIQPILNNAHGGQFDEGRLARLLQSPQNQQTLANATRDWLLSHHFDGLNLDLENMNAEDLARFPQFVALMSRTLKAANLTLSVDVEADHATDARWKQIAQDCDFLILMAYNEHGADSTDPGAIASAKWSYDLLQQFKANVPLNKIVLGVSNYAYDWTRGKPLAQTVTYQGAISLARDYRSDTTPEQAVDFDDDALETTFEYSDDAGGAHEVWMTDGVSAFNQWKLAQHDGVRGAALWVLGSEDPTIWSFLDRSKMSKAPSPDGLSTIHFPTQVGFEGQGEVLTVHSTPQMGVRKITIDEDNGLCTDMEYQKYPSPFVLQRSGYQKNAIALTFDDGPQAGFTEPILDILRENHVPGTFFMIGENAERNPKLVRRVYAEGNEIGSHTFTHPNLGEVSTRRATLELNATQRALESILGHSTILFRPPYNADAEPQTEAEVRPVVLASQMGYVTIGELIDPQDWNLFKTGVDGAPAPRSADELAHSILSEVHKANQPNGDNGNMLLLHDGGGDRTNTIEALRIVIPELKKEGYHFVSVSQLMGVSRDAVMPRISDRDRLLVGFDRVIFDAVFLFESGLRIAFVAAIVLGLARVLFVTPLALIAWRRDKKTSLALSSTGNQNWPTVSVLVAAYNEEKVIVRTIRSILSSEYPRPFEVVVVDDGSRDGTAEEVEKNFADESHVRLIRQENGGKASALNRAIEAANGEVLVCFDADTQIAPDAIAIMARHFVDEEVGAVAGNVKVGNRLNLLTRWQSIEYITSQNLDRRAYALLNAITVVPGAIGAWRREAVMEAGGYTTDTLAEDMDLTWRIRRAGWRLATDSGALAWTEAPDTVRGFFNQRFRWAYGTLQCLWKHRGALGRYGWFGGLALPMLWLFQFVFQVIAPLVDLQILYSLLGFANSKITSVVLHQDWQPMTQAKSDLTNVLIFYAIFFAAELLGATIAFLLDKERVRQLGWLFPQRFVYRQLMYAVVWKALWKAARGLPQGWGKLQRKGTVQTPVSSANNAAKTKENVSTAP